MTTTSGGRPSECMEASRSSASVPPPAVPTTSISGSPARNATNPRRTTSWSSTTSTWMASSPAGSISGPIRFRRDADSYQCPRPRRSRDGEPPSDLSSTASHRVEAEVTGMSGGRVKAPPVVADLQDDLAVLSVDMNVCRARPGVLLDVCERFSSDGEQLCFNELGQRKVLLGPPDVDGKPVRSPETGRVSGKRRDQPVVDGVAVQVEDQRAHLALNPPAQVRNCTEGAADAAGWIAALLDQSLLGRACVQYPREEGLRHGIVEISSDATAFLRRPFALIPACVGQLPGGSFPFADDAAHEQRRQRRDPDVELRAQCPVVDGLLGERAEFVGGYADCHTGGDRDGKRRAPRAEAECCPNQRGKDHVPDRLLRRERHDAERGNGRDHG